MPPVKLTTVNVTTVSPAASAVYVVLVAPVASVVLTLLVTVDTATWSLHRPVAPAPTESTSLVTVAVTVVESPTVRDVEVAATATEAGAAATTAAAAV